MPALRLIAEGVGPFERLDLDLSDGKGNPHLGPHILAGINGSGKSTALKTLAWLLDWGIRGFNNEEWQHSLSGHSHSRALLFLRPLVISKPYAYVCTTRVGEDRKLIKNWVRRSLADARDDANDLEFARDRVLEQHPLKFQWARFGGPREPVGKALFGVAAYVSSRSLKSISNRPFSRVCVLLGEVSTSRNCQMVFEAQLAGWQTT